MQLALKAVLLFEITCNDGQSAIQSHLQLPILVPTEQSLICEISPAGVGNSEVVGKVREPTEFSSLFKVHNLSSRGDPGIKSKPATERPYVTSQQ